MDPRSTEQANNGRRWEIWVDTGGTFTDCLARDPGGRLRRAKVLSNSALRGTIERTVDPVTLRVREDWGAPADLISGFAFRPLGGPESPIAVAAYDPVEGLLRLAAPLASRPTSGSPFEVRSPDEAPVLAARLVTGTPAGMPLPPLNLRLATTRGTNALLERAGSPVAFFVTAGWRDLLRIGTQQRPDLFALKVRRPPGIHDRTIEVPERLAASGEVVRPLELEEVRRGALNALAAGVRVAAVALMHSYRNGDHERRLETFLLELGFDHVSRSSALAPAIKLLPRAETAVVDAYLTPVISRYLQGVRDGISREGASGGEASLHVMTSAGGLVRPEEFRAKDSLLSGPAGGVVGAARAGRRSGFERVIAFDMGGTSTDVARFDGDFEYVWEHRVGDAVLMAPALAIESVAAGGGSICAHDANGLRVGPESAGANPGPACYGAGGPPTITDVNLLLGRLRPEQFGIPISIDAARIRLDQLRRAVREDAGAPAAPEPFLAGLLEIANERMADAIRAISLRRGYDPAEYALVAFGGAGGQHACAVAERLGIRTAIVPAEAGLLSALGIGHAVIERFAERQVLRPLDEVGAEMTTWIRMLIASATAAVEREGVPLDEIVVRRRIANLRFSGQESTLSVEIEPGGSLREAFEASYRATYGHLPEARAVEVESLRVIASSRPVEEPVPEAPPAAAVEPSGRSALWSVETRAAKSSWVDVPNHQRDQLPAGARIRGPALVLERHAATVVEAGWDARVDGAGALVLEHRSSGTGDEAGDGMGDTFGSSGQPEAVVEELFTSRFQALVTEMGEMLRRTALSTNVKERLDYSCALLDADGELVVNAPHIPVHLGALGLCVRAVRDALPMRGGDVVVTNHPAFGGSHLPDVTVITPVHFEEELVGYVANRAHHAEIGGTRPGSMPPDARNLAEEGVVIAPSYLVECGVPRWEEIRSLLTGTVHPTRAVEDNLADLRAQVAANHRGAQLLEDIARAHGPEALSRYMGRLTARAERRAREAFARLEGQSFEALERLDDGAEIRVRIEVADESAVVDFTGTAGVQSGNLNATPAIVRSAILYVLRLLSSEPLPLNEGLIRPVEVRLPKGMLNPEFPDDPALCPAVVGGNTELSQRLVDTLLKALGLVACSQGTMNNLLWGTDRFGYYETICGGSGAGPGWEGESAIHCHMTNTRITDPEVVEHRYPVRVERFEVREGSGGRGRWRGGDGARREIAFLEPMSVSMLTQHRVERPYGGAGGEGGAVGRQRLVRADGAVVELGPVDGCEAEPGDRLIVETPGGGGWGD